MSCSSRTRFALRRRIERFVTLESESIAVGGRQVAWLRVLDGERLLTSAVSETGGRAAEEIDPFWAATWRAAQGLDCFLASLDLAGCRILELGCGSGRAGIGAALRGGLVTLTDAVGLALLVARLNGLNAGLDSKRLHIQRLRWEHETLAKPAFPLVIGSDVVYDPALFPLLDACARRHLAPGGRMLLSEPHRHTGDRFAGWIRSRGWATTEHDVDLGDGRIPIRVFECRLE